MWKTKIIIEELGKVNATSDEINFVEKIINGGKTDHTERAKSICAYLGMEGQEEIVYNKLCALANER